MEEEHLKNRWAAAYKKAAELFKQEDTQKLRQRSGLSIRDKTLSFTYLNTAYTLSWPDIAFTPGGLSVAEQILILHYLTSGGKPAAEAKYISYPQLPGGMFYDYAFRKNGPGRLLYTFSKNPEPLIPAAQSLGGKPASYQDISVKLTVLPEIEVIIVFQRADEEFPPEVNILFRDDIVSYFSLEDISLLAGFIAGKLAGASNTSG